MAQKEALTATPSPEWIDDVAEQLDRIKGLHAQRKRDTIVALVTARLEKRSDNWAFKQGNTANRTTYHRSWKFDPEFADVLAEVERLAIHWRNQVEARALAEAASRLSMLAPVSVTVAAKALRSQDLNIALKAAFGIMDRAGLGVKAQVEHTGPEGMPVGTLMSLEEWRRHQATRRQEAENILAVFDENSERTPDVSA